MFVYASQDDPGMVTVTMVSWDKLVGGGGGGDTCMCLSIPGILYFRDQTPQLRFTARLVFKDSH